MGLPSPLTLNYNSNGYLTIQLPQGPQSDSYFVYLSVNIIDDFNGKTTSQLPMPVQVLPNNNDSNIFEAILTNNGESLNTETMIELNSGNLNLISKNVISLSNALNSQDVLSSFDNDQKAMVREYLMDKLNIISVSDISSIKVLSSAMSVVTQIPNQASSNLAVWVFILSYTFNLKLKIKSYEKKDIVYKQS